MIAIVCNDKLCRSWQGHRFAAALSDVLSSLGYPAEVVEVPKNRPDFMIVIGIKSLNPQLRVWGVPVILYKVDLFKHNQWVRRLAKFGFDFDGIFGVIDYCPRDRLALSKVGIDKWVFAPLGYHPSFEILNGCSITNSYDIGFLGTVSRRRGRIIGELLGENFSMLQNEGDDGRKFMSSSSLWLNLHRKHTKNFADIRVIQLGLSNGCFVISEPCSWVPEGMKDGVHWVVLQKFFLCEQIRWALDNPEERTRIAKAGYEWVKSSYRLIDNWREPMKNVLSWI